MYNIKTVKVMVSKQKNKDKSQKKSKSKSKLPSTVELLKMYDDNSFLKNFKNKELSELIKDKSENDIQKNAIKIGGLIYKLVIKRMPIIIYTLIKLDNDLGKLSLLRNPVIKAIYMNKGTKLQKINQLYNYLVMLIQDNPTVLFTIIKIMNIKDIFDDRKVSVKLSDPYVIINIVIFILNLQNKDNQSLDDIINNLSKIPFERRNDNVKNQIELLTTIRNCLNDSEMCEYRKISNEINQNQESLFSKFFRKNKDSDSESDILDDSGDDNSSDDS